MPFSLIARLAARPPAATPLAAAGRAVRFERWRGRDDFLAAEAALAGASLHAAERALAAAHADTGALPGWCTWCLAPTRFAFRPVAGDGVPNWREELACAGCGLIARSRLAFAAAFAEAPAAPRLYFTEQAAPAWLAARRRFPHAVGSEFVADDRVRERLSGYLAEVTAGAVRAVRHEDVTRLGLPTRSVDRVLSFDVLEHVPDFRAALREFRRVLAPGGRLVMTVPFDLGRERSLVRARLGAGGSVEHLEPPEYHGDPTSDAGCLAFYTYSWDLLQELRGAGFASAAVWNAWQPGFGLLGFAGLIVAER